MKTEICIHENITIDIDCSIHKGGSNHPLSEDPPYRYADINSLNIYIEIPNGDKYLKIQFSKEQQDKYLEQFYNKIMEEL